MSSLRFVHRVARRKPNRIDLIGVLTVIVPVDRVFVDAVSGDEATLESTDGSYKQSIRVGEIGRKESSEHIRLRFRNVLPGKSYTLTYDMKQDDDANDVGKVIMFSERQIGMEDLQEPIRLEIPFQDDEG